VKRVGPGDIAVIDHTNIDRIAAEELISTGVRGVINASDSSNGRYPNSGPLLLVRAGIRLVDAPRAPLFDRLRDGDPLTLDGGRVLASGEEVVVGRVLQADELAHQLDEQRQRVDSALAAFAENTVAHIRHEGALLTGAIDYPPTRTTFRDRHVLIVVRGTTHRRDLQALRAYIRDVRPVLVAVDGGADALLEVGLRPDIIIGDFDSVSAEALACGADLVHHVHPDGRAPGREELMRYGVSYVEFVAEGTSEDVAMLLSAEAGAELIVHAYPDGRAPGSRRVVDLGLDHSVIPAAGTSQDVAMLMAYEKGAALIVSVGAHFNLIEFLDKNRDGMSSTFLTRLRIGETLVDAKGVSRLYNPGLGLGHLSLFFVVFAILLVIVVLTSPALDDFSRLLWLKIKILLGI
jgi:uncharacterized membrane-anchored protein